MQAPQFPNGSLAGPLPSFPISYATIPNVLDLPGWVYAMITYYGDVLNVPYSNPPSLPTWQIPYPNIWGIPQFILQIGVWVIGLFAAVFEWIFAEISYLGVTYIGQLFTALANGLTDGINTVQQLSQQAGVFAPLVETAFFGAILFAGILIASLIVNTLTKVA